MRQIKHRLWKIRCLHDTAHLDGSFILDELADEEQQFRRELNPLALHVY